MTVAQSIGHDPQLSGIALAPGARAHQTSPAGEDDLGEADDEIDDLDEDDEDEEDAEEDEDEDEEDNEDLDDYDDDPDTLDEETD